ncbi:MAG: hypothetical protein HY656_00835, partial [Acidobacteria bacterium]|nr:hypothetical protein [Acidobacteriota bacterium]
PIQVCIDFSALGLTTTEGLKLYHFENGEGVNRTVSVDLANQIACAEVSFLSPFALFTPLNELFVSNFQTFIPHSAQGGGFLTRLFVTNPSNQPNRLSITRRDPSGTILETTETTLGPGGTVQLAGTEAERVGALGVEWLALGSEYPLAASILFDFDSASLDLAEDFRTAVGALPGPPVSSFTVPVRVATLDVTVSLALANLTDADNQVTLTLRDTTGATRATDSLTLGPFAQAAFSLQDRDAFRNAVLGVPEFVGSLDVAATDPAAPLAALVAANERGQLTSLPVSQSTMDAVSPPPPDPIAGGGPRTFLPHSATGGGFLTRVLLTNLTRSINVVTLHRYEQNGLLGDRRILSLPPQGTVLLADSEAARAGPLGINWFALRSDFEIIASMLFDFDSAALGLAEDFRTAVSALPSLPLLAFTAPVRVAGVEDTVGLALANLSSQSTEVTLKLRDASGTVVAEDSLVLDGLAQTAFVLHDRAAFRDVLLGSGEFLGSLAVTSGQPVAALVVGSSNRQLFALPVTPGAAE